MMFNFMFLNETEKELVQSLNGGTFNATIRAIDNFAAADVDLADVKSSLGWTTFEGGHVMTNPNGMRANAHYSAFWSLIDDNLNLIFVVDSNSLFLPPPEDE